MNEAFLRGKAFNLCLLASARAGEDPLEAVRVGIQAVEIAEGISSRRSHAYLRELGHRFGPHAKLTEVADLRQRITGLTRAG